MNFNVESIQRCESVQKVRHNCKQHKFWILKKSFRKNEKNIFIFTRAVPRAKPSTNTKLKSPVHFVSVVFPTCSDIVSAW